MDTVRLVGRLIISLAVVLLMIWILARRLRGKGLRKVRSGKLIEVLSRQSLTRNSSVAVVRVADRALIVGVAESAVSVLGELELDAAAASLANVGITAPTPTTVPAAVTETAYDAGTSTEGLTVRIPAPAAPPRLGALAGSALSPGTWRQTLDALRDMTVRRS